MITIENCKVYGWETAIRGMRNPKNSWDRSDTVFASDGSLLNGLGQNDYQLMKKLADAGQVHGKFLRMICVSMDITAPLYWWKEWDTYKVGTVCNSCSTMHKIASRDLTLDDFSTDHMYPSSKTLLEIILSQINSYRDGFVESHVKGDWWQIIQLLPSSYNQKRTVLLNYAVLKNMYEYRHDHKLDEWVDFCQTIKRLPYSELITGGSNGRSL